MRGQHPTVKYVVLLISTIGFLSTINAGIYLHNLKQGEMMSLFVFALLYIAAANWAVTLPSGLKFRPVVTFVLFGMLNYPYQVVIIIPLFGLILIAVLNKQHWMNIFTTLGHLSLGIYTGGFFYHLLLPQTSFSLPSAYPAILLALIIHFAVNRGVAALIIAYRKKSKFINQLRLIKNDFNWAYFCVYLLAVQMLITYKFGGFWGVVGSVFLLITIYRAVQYFQQYKVVAKKAFTDALTGAENRAAWELFIEEMKQEKLSGSLVMMDLDNFKILNDHFGHEFGDQKLVDFVSDLKSGLQRDYRLFRYGGDEFILYVPHKHEEYTVVLQEINGHIDAINRKWKKQSLNLSISSGMTQIHENSDIAMLFRTIDQLMYNEKFLKKKGAPQPVHQYQT